MRKVNINALNRKKSCRDSTMCCPYKTGIGLVVVFYILSFTFFCYAKDVAFQATVDANKVGLGQPIQLDLTFDNTQNMPAPDPPAVEGFRANYLGPSTRISIINGKATSSITHTYTLLPAKVGKFQVGPFKLAHEGDNYTSNAITIDVRRQPTEKQSQEVPGGLPNAKDLEQRIYLTMQVPKYKVYLNEIVPVAIKMHINKLGARDVQYPKFNHDGFSIGEFEKAKQYQDVVDGVGFDIIEFNASIFGLKPGEFRIGPATLQCNLIVANQKRQASSSADFFNFGGFDNFFNQYEAYPLTLRSQEVLITVLPLPEENKPEDFNGALGVFDFEASANPLEVKVGDPITLKEVVRGTGNFGTVSLPGIASDNNFKAYQPQVKQGEGVKSFEQVLIPLNADITEVPAIRFSYFNTDTGSYETITRGPFPVNITQPDKEEEQKIIENRQPGALAVNEEKLGSDIIYIKDNPGRLSKKGEFLYQNKIFLRFQVIPLLLYLLLAAFQARSKRLKTDVRYARLLLAPRKAKAGIRRSTGLLEKGDVRGFYDVLFETLQEYLGDKFHLPSKGITISVIDEQLKHRGVPQEAMTKLKDIFSECDMARYASSQFSKENMRNSLTKLEEIVDSLQRSKI
ncbi:MAG: BatD family protein [Candidatus Omnitrophota bacterium]|nr:BatD family protein [Candidatus Omnitrophota bacterium]